MCWWLLLHSGHVDGGSVWLMLDRVVWSFTRECASWACSLAERTSIALSASPICSICISNCKTELGKKLEYFALEIMFMQAKRAPKILCYEFKHLGKLKLSAWTSRILIMFILIFSCHCLRKEKIKTL